MVNKIFVKILLFSSILSPISSFLLFQSNAYSYIEFETNGGTPVQVIKHLEGAVIDFPETTKEGYSFAGWYQDSGLSEAFTLTQMPANDITVYAKWSINQYTISFQSNGGTSVNPITQDYGTSVSAPTPPTKTGYTFMGWYSETNLVLPFTFALMPAQSITLYARWLNGDGSEETPFEITNASDIELLRLYPNLNFKLKNNIELSTSQITIPNFSGRLDGNEKKLTLKKATLFNIISSSANIYNLDVHVDLALNQNIYFEQSILGFFANSNFGNINNLQITFSNFTLTLNPTNNLDTHYLGFFGKNNGTIDQIDLISGNINLKRTTKNFIFGPLVGWNIGTVENAENMNLMITSQSIDTGGVVGYSSGILKNIINRGNVSNQIIFYDEEWHTMTGGIASEIAGLSENLINYGDITATSNNDYIYLGGIAGQINTNIPTTIIGLINFGAIRGYNPNDTYTGFIETIFGGITSFLGEKVTLERSKNHGTLSNIPLTTTLKNFDSIIGGLVGINSGTILESFNVGYLNFEDKGIPNLGGIVGRNEGIVERSFNKGNIKSINSSSTSYVGGIVGSLNGGSILDIYNQGAIELVNNSVADVASACGGLVGVIDLTSESSSIINGYASGTMSGLLSKNWFGGIVGVTENTIYTIQNTHYFKATNVAYGISVNQSNMGTSQYTSITNMYLIASALGNQWRNIPNGLPKLVWETN